MWLPLVLVIIALCVWKIWKSHTYWTGKGVIQGGNQIPILGDNYGNVLRIRTFPEDIVYMYNKITDVRYHGLYQFMLPSLCIRDPELLRQLTIKDFDNFTDHFSFVPEGLDPLWNNNLLMLKGEKWRQMRPTLSPAFTSSKMKAMYYLMTDCAEQFIAYFRKNNSTIIEVDLKDVFSKYTNDVIASCAFGVTCNSLENDQNEFYVMGKRFSNFTGIWKNIQFVIMLLCPKLAKFLGIRFIPEEVADFFTKLVSGTMKYREEHQVVRPDMIHLLMEARKGQLKYEESSEHSKETGFATVEESSMGSGFKVAHKKEITDADVTAQALVFFFAGFESSANLLCFMGYELAINPDVQERLREEIDEAFEECNGKITYDRLNKLKYLDMVTSESLRKWPGILANDRVCVAPYTIEPVNRGEVPIHLDKGDLIFIPVYAMHFDPQYFPEPNRFDPERFSEENKKNIIPGTFMPFGMGPRNCIGSRFALLETKLLYCYLLSEYEIVPTQKTEIPIKLAKGGFNLQAENGIRVGLKKRTK